MTSFKSIASGERSARQLALDLPLAPSKAREDFVCAASNADALRLIEQWPHWPSNALIVAGPEGAGKSHLAEIWRARTDAEIIEAADLPQRISRPFTRVAYVVENAATPELDQTALFHLINLASEQGFSLLLTAKSRPALWPVSVRDLASRLASMPCVELAPPDDLLLAAVMTKLFADRQVLVEPGVIAYMLPRMERSLAAANAVVAQLDAVAMAEARPITRALAARVLDAHEMDDQIDLPLD
jgi:chromosomal replication initiation ATPase DnaA